MPNKIKILVADDHAIVRDGLVTLLKFQKRFTVVGEADTGLSAVKLACKLNPDVIVMDMMMPDIDGAEATRRIKCKCPNIQILIITSFTSSASLALALENGAIGAITKSSTREHLYDAILSAAAGQRFVDKEIEISIHENKNIPALTQKQHDILQALSKGLTNRELSEQTGISTAGIKFHLLAIFRKLNANNRSDAVAIALRKHLLKI